MKKIFFALVAISLVFVSCKKDNKDAGTTTPEEPTPDAFSIKMTVSGTPTATTADVVCEPSDESLYYFAAYAPAEAKSEIDAAYLAEYAYETIEMYVMYGYGFEDVAMAGKQTMGLTGLTPETDFFACAVQIDEDETVYEDLFTCDFRTAALKQSSMTIDIVYDDATTVTFTPSASDPFGLYIEDKEGYDDFCAQAGITGDGWAENIQAWLDTYAQYAAYGLSFPTYTTTQAVDLTAWFEGDTVPAGTDLVAYAAPVLDGYVNGTGYGIVFAPKDTIFGKPAADKMPMKKSQKTILRAAVRR